MVSTFDAQVAVTPGGSPVGIPILVATVVVLVMIRIVLTHTLGLLVVMVGWLISRVIALVAELQLPLVAVTVCVPPADTVKGTPLVMACEPDHV